MNSLRKYITLCLIVLLGLQTVQAQLIKIASPQLGQSERVDISVEDKDGNIVILKSNHTSKKSIVQRYNGTYWVESKPAALINNPENLVVYDELTFCTGTNFKDFFVNVWDGKSWTFNACGLSPRRNVDSSMFLVEHDNKVYLFGSAFNSINGAPHTGSAVYDNDGWKATKNPYPDFVDKAISAFDTLYVLGKNRAKDSDKIYKYVNDVLTDSIPEGNFILSSGDNILFKDGPLYIRSEGGNYINYTDSLKAYGIQEIYAGDEYNGRIILHANVSGIDGLLNLENKRFVPLANNKGTRIHSNINGDFVSHLELPFNRFYPLAKIEWESALIQGQVFIDDNKTCFLEAGDVPMSNISVSLDSFSTTTDNEGKYFLYVPEGTSGTLKMDGLKYYNISNCDTTKVFPVNTDSIYTRNLVLWSDSIVNDLDVRLEGKLVRQGQRAYYKAYIKNIGTAISEARKLSIIYDSRLSDFQSGVNHTIVNQEVLFDIPSLNIQEEMVIAYSLYVTETILSLGDTLLHVGFIETGNDVDSTNNRDTLIEEVVAAFDPNRKECIPYGIVTAPIDKIIYTIRFQNTGTDTAFMVTVVDTLERHLPMEGARAISSSHPLTYKLLPPKGNTITWQFENIMLPDSGRNFAESQGFITFEVKLKNDLKVGDSIRNRAHIYFDYQKPVTTNFARVVKESEQIEPPSNESQILVYPNPSNSSVYVKNNRSEDINFTLYDICGKLIFKERVGSNEKKEINLDRVSLGIYVMRYENGYIGKLVKSK